MKPLSVCLGLAALLYLASDASGELEDRMMIGNKQYVKAEYQVTDKEAKDLRKMWSDFIERKKYNPHAAQEEEEEEEEEVDQSKEEQDVENQQAEQGPRSSAAVATGLFPMEPTTMLKMYIGCCGVLTLCILFLPSLRQTYLRHLCLGAALSLVWESAICIGAGDNVLRPLVSWPVRGLWPVVNAVWDGLFLVVGVFLLRIADVGPAGSAAFHSGSWAELALLVVWGVDTGVLVEALFNGGLWLHYPVWWNPTVMAFQGAVVPLIPVVFCMITPTLHYFVILKIFGAQWRPGDRVVLLASKVAKVD